MEISQAVQFVEPDVLYRPAFPSVRTTAFPTSSDCVFSNAPRIVDAWTFIAGMVRLRNSVAGAHSGRVAAETCTSVATRGEQVAEVIRSDLNQINETRPPASPAA